MLIDFGMSGVWFGQGSLPYRISMGAHSKLVCNRRKWTNGLFFRCCQFRMSINTTNTTSIAAPVSTSSISNPAVAIKPTFLTKQQREELALAR